MHTDKNQDLKNYRQKNFEVQAAVRLRKKTPYWFYPCESVCIRGCNLRSVVKPVPQLYENLARVAEMESAEGQAVVQHHAAVAHIQRTG